MAHNYSLSFVGFIDNLWFHQCILLSESTILLVPKTLKQTHLISESLYRSSTLSLGTSSEKEEISSPQEGSSESPPLTLLDESNVEEEEEDDDDDDESMKKERPTRLNLFTSRVRSHSSSPSTKKGSKDIRHSGAVGKLQKSMSCRSLKELELEEVKGLMDLGFIFKKEHLSPRMISIVPGLQRLGLYRNKKNTKLTDIEESAGQKLGEAEEVGEYERERGIIRPYLSEAWLIRRPNSPLLNLRMPRVSAASDMKKHLRFWARTVAYVIQQESQQEFPFEIVGAKVAQTDNLQ